MKTNIFIVIFLVLGLAAIGGCLYFATLPTVIFGSRRGDSDSYINGNAGTASIAMAIISVGCFIASTFLIRKK